MRLSRGIVDAEMPKLFLDPVKIEETLGSDTVYKRELYLASENNLYIKGLAYSSHSRVKILKNAFGGLRNHIVYEVDTSWCENGDLIKGNFTLVTNSGELEVPFLFRVEMIESVRVLSTLKSMDDFVELAKKDMELALRLMEYRDFTEAPLFKDLRIRTIYEGLRGHGNRQNALEEFFLATGVKEPIELTLSTAKKVYDKPKDIVNDKVVLRKNTWGYLYMEVRADGDFIEIPKKVITQADFEEDRLDLRFRIHPERMHKGKNLGAIRLLTVHGDTVIRIEAMGEEPDRKRAEGEISKAGVCRYMKLREAYESGLYEKKAVLGKIQNELDAIRGANGGDPVPPAGGDLSGRGETGSGGFMSGRCVGYRFCPQRPDRNTLLLLPVPAVPSGTGRGEEGRCGPPVQEKAGGRQRPVLSAAFAVKDAAGDVRGGGSPRGEL